MASTHIDLSLDDLETLIRRVVREELARLSDAPTSILHDWRHEGPDDPAGDEALAREAEALSRNYRAAPEELTTLEDFERELAEPRPRVTYRTEITPPARTEISPESPAPGGI